MDYSTHRNHEDNYTAINLTQKSEADSSLENLKNQIYELNSQVDIYTTLEQEEHLLIISGLSEILQQTYNLYLKTHNCRWKTTETLPDSLDELLEQQYTEMTTGVEVLTQQIRALGMTAPDPNTEFLRLSSGASTTELLLLEEMILGLIQGNEKVLEEATLVSEQAKYAGYWSLANVLTERTEIHKANAADLSLIYLTLNPNGLRHTLHDDLHL